MLVKSISYFFTFMLVFSICHAEDIRYNDIIKSDPKYEELDKQLQKSCNKITGQLSSIEEDILNKEQKYWKDKVFKYDVSSLEDKKHNRDEAIRIALQNRINEINKLNKLAESNGILGMPVQFGMSKKEICTKLKIKDPSLLNKHAFDMDDKPAYYIKLFGEKTPINFRFLTTTFKKGENTKPDEFKKFVNNVLKNDTRNIKEKISLTSLFSVSTGNLSSEEDYDILNNELSKKYKISYIKTSNDGLEFDHSSFTEHVFEDSQKYIFTQGYWPRLADGGFTVTYYSKPYLLLNINTENQFINKLMNVLMLNHSLGILPEFATIENVIWAFGDGTLTFGTYDFDFYILDVTKPTASIDQLTLYVQPDNKVFGFQLIYGEDAFGDQFEQEFIDKIKTDYKEINPPASVLHFVINSAACYETNENFISLGFIPHVANIHTMTVVNKNIANEYYRLCKLRDAKNYDPDAEKKLKDWRREESRKF